MPYALIAIGAVAVLAHLAPAVHGVLGIDGWVSGVAIGALVAGLVNHIRIFGRT